MKKTVEFFDNLSDVKNLTFTQKTAYASRLQGIVKILNSQISSIKDDIAQAHITADYECVAYKVTHSNTTMYNVPESVKKPYAVKKHIVKVTIR